MLFVPLQKDLAWNNLSNILAEKDLMVCISGNTIIAFVPYKCTLTAH